MNPEYPKVPLRSILQKVEDAVVVEPEVTYKQVTVRLFHRGVVLRGHQTGAEIRTIRQWRVRAGQILLSRIDARNGAIGILPPDLDGAIVTNDFWAFEVVKGAAEPLFLDVYFGTGEFVEACRRASEGTTNRVRLQLDRFLDVTVPLPALEEQRRIVARIEELAAKIEQARELRRRVTNEMQGLIPSTLRKVLAPAEGWQLRLISDCAHMSTGTTPPSHRDDYYGGDLQWYTPADLEFQQKLERSSRTVSDIAMADGKVRMFEPGTVLLVAIGASLGKIGLTREPCSANQQITGLKFSSDILPEYGFWWIRSLHNELRATAPQATLPIINQRRIGGFAIAIPPVPEQRRIVTYLSHLQAKVDALKRLQVETAARIDGLMPSILDKAFRGELP